MSRWMGMDTAPKDGTSVLLSGKYSEAVSSETVFIGHFGMINKRWKWEGEHMWRGEPSGWMPLPKPNNKEG